MGQGEQHLSFVPEFWSPLAQGMQVRTSRQVSVRTAPWGAGSIGPLVVPLILFRLTKTGARPLSPSTDYLHMQGDLGCNSIIAETWQWQHLPTSCLQTGSRPRAGLITPVSGSREKRDPGRMQSRNSQPMALVGCMCRSRLPMREHSKGCKGADQTDQ